MRLLPLVLCAALVALTVTMHRAPSTPLPNGAEPVETEVGLDWFRSDPEVDGVLEVYDAENNLAGNYYLLDGVLYQGPGQPGRAVFRVTKSFIDPGLDLGVWAGYSAGPVARDPERLQAGIRLSPVRLGYGTVAPEFVASHDLGGVGFTVYPPTQYFGRHWRHIGVGAWYCAPWGGGSDPGWVFGLGFSTRD